MVAPRRCLGTPQSQTPSLQFKVFTSCEAFKSRVGVKTPFPDSTRGKIGQTHCSLYPVPAVRLPGWALEAGYSGRHLTPPLPLKSQIPTPPPRLRLLGTTTGFSPLERTPRRSKQISEGPNPDVSAGLPGVAAPPGRWSPARPGEHRLRCGSQSKGCAGAGSECGTFKEITEKKTPQTNKQTPKESILLKITAWPRSLRGNRFSEG